jgi:LmbE family N-acetylglucosaminyl deacetylase
VIGLAPGELTRIGLLGAHCDDIAIGAGATLAGLCGAHPGLRVEALVLTGAGTARAAEEQAALAALCGEAKLELRVLALPDGRFPAHWEEVKDALTELRGRFDPELLMGPHRADQHQDHRTVAAIAPQVFRNDLLLGYEIPKWDGDLLQPSCYRPISGESLDRKCAVLDEHYPSQRGKDWFDAETFRGLARLRGVQCHARYAEAFHVEKWVLE